MEQWNPYTATSAQVDPNYVDTTKGFLTPKDASKAEAVIKEANQFWLAIICVFLCSAFGILLIAPWYTVRYFQWKGLAKKYPSLLSPNAPHGSLAYRFTNARWKLLSCIIVGAVVLALIVMFVVASVVLAET